MIGHRCFQSSNLGDQPGDVDDLARARVEARGDAIEAGRETLVQRFPSSEYAEDARQRMVFLRNRLASYEVYVAEYYLERGAYVGALNRARYAVENYDGAPQIRRALLVMADAYERLGMTELASDTEKVIRENFANVDEPQPVDEEEKSWWKFW